MIKIVESWVKQYPIVSLEDGLAENDWNGWKQLTDALGNKIELVEDDFFAQTKKILQDGINRNMQIQFL
jgi:enolase